MTAKDPRVLGVQAEYQPHAEDIQAVQGGLVLGVDVLLQDGVVEPSHQLARLHGDLLLAVDKLALFFHKESKAVVFLGQVAELDALGLSRGLLHIVDQKLLKITGDDPTGALGVGERGGVPLGLLEGVEQSPIGLANGTAEVEPLLFLFNENVS